jgi:hypothetical protein
MKFVGKIGGFTAILPGFRDDIGEMESLLIEAGLGFATILVKWKMGQEFKGSVSRRYW